MRLSAYLESQVAPNSGPLYPKVTHNSLKTAHNYRPLSFQVAFLSVFGLESSEILPQKVQSLGVATSRVKQWHLQWCP